MLEVLQDANSSLDEKSEGDESAHWIAGKSEDERRGAVASYNSTEGCRLS